MRGHLVGREPLTCLPFWITFLGDRFSGGLGVPDSGQMGVFHAEKRRILKTEDSLTERGEFELSGDFVNGQ
jgi:hypothetical protein